MQFDQVPKIREHWVRPRVIEQDKRRLAFIVRQLPCQETVARQARDRYMEFDITFGPSSILPKRTRIDTSAKKTSTNIWPSDSRRRKQGDRWLFRNKVRSLAFKLLVAKPWPLSTIRTCPSLLMGAMSPFQCDPLGPKNPEVIPAPCPFVKNTTRLPVHG
jgi:hypothetical protein